MPVRCDGAGKQEYTAWPLLQFKCASPSAHRKFSSWQLAVPNLSEPPEKQVHALACVRLLCPDADPMESQCITAAALCL